MDAFGDFTLEDRTILLASNAVDATLLITGPTGTGKSHLALRMHETSPMRRLGRFHKINLATLSEGLLESELFGHEKGSFTGADSRRVGRIEACAGGTLFLDEVGELPLRLQAKLLDFIQYKRIVPIGANREIVVDVRIIAATNRDLAKAATRGEFREDLYHRLKVFHIDMALRGDTLASDLYHAHFSRVFANDWSPASTEPAAEWLLVAYSAGNIGSWKTPWSLHVG